MRNLYELIRITIRVQRSGDNVNTLTPLLWECFVLNTWRKEVLILYTVLTPDSGGVHTLLIQEHIANIDVQVIHVGVLETPKRPAGAR